MMVESSGPLVETASMPRIVKPELLIIEVVAELVAKSAEECAEGRDFFSHCRPHPEPDQHSFGIVVAEKLHAPILAGSQGWAERTRMPH